MAINHYETLGVSRKSSRVEIRSAYRKLVLIHHPDRSKDPKSQAVLAAAMSAYEVLSDPDRKIAYDSTLDFESAREKVRSAPPKPTAAPPRKPTAPAAKPKPSVTPDNKQDLARLSRLVSTNRYVQAEVLAREILRRSPKEAAAFGILGDIARSRGNFDSAINYFARAVQADPRNAVYQQRYEQLLNTEHKRVVATTNAPQYGMLLLAGLVCVFATVYVALSKETSAFHSISLISSWGLGTAAMLFICGATVGAGLSWAGMIDRLSAVSLNSMGKASPIIGLGLIAVVSFWAAALIYIIVALVQNMFNFSLSRVFFAVAVVVLMVGFGSTFTSTLVVSQVLMWGGNLSFIGAISGWIVADSLRS